MGNTATGVGKAFEQITEALSVDFTNDVNVTNSKPDHPSDKPASTIFYDDGIFFAFSSGPTNWTTKKDLHYANRNNRRYFVNSNSRYQPGRSDDQWSGGTVVAETAGS